MARALSLLDSRQISQGAVIPPPCHDDDLLALLPGVTCAGDAAQVVVTGEDPLHGLGPLAHQSQQPIGLRIREALVIICAGHTIGTVAAGHKALNILLTGAADGNQGLLECGSQINGAIAINTEKFLPLRFDLRQGSHAANQGHFLGAAKAGIAGNLLRPNCS